MFIQKKTVLIVLHQTIPLIKELQNTVIVPTCYLKKASGSLARNI